MDVARALARRRMVRSFDGTPVDPDWLDELCATALWAPTAGNCAGVRMRTIYGDARSAFFTQATDENWRERSTRFAGLARAGAVVVVTSRPQDYSARYGEADKRASGLESLAAWPVPYWHGDAAMATMALLLLLEESGWAATVWGDFGRATSLLAWLGAADEVLFASVLVGRGDPSDRRSASLERPVPARRARVSRVASRPDSPAR